MAGVDDVGRGRGQAIRGDGDPVGQVRRGLGDVGTSGSAGEVQPGQAADPMQGKPGRSCFQSEGVDHLIGDFSFAIWDKSQQRLFCAVDILSCLRGS